MLLLLSSDATRDAPREAPGTCAPSVSPFEIEFPGTLLLPVGVNEIDMLPLTALVEMVLKLFAFVFGAPVQLCIVTVCLSLALLILLVLLL